MSLCAFHLNSPALDSSQPFSAFSLRSKQEKIGISSRILFKKQERREALELIQGR